ncbi:hypothetical protein M5K25_007835 [Dendrobium thyrsiflorum]|uniref:Fe2OG dioxygenase domain-containing protein n=1 Tax=Dendrobium thyrsiflorum TaxID=117978 RepID=A0ABD0VFU4_DENTH
MAKEGIVVPVIDLANFPAELEKLAAASTEVGCFQVINHGIPVALLAEMKETARSLFELPEEVKRRNVNPNVIDGRYRPRNFEPNGKYHESFSIYDAALPSDVLSFCSALDVSPQQRKVITEYFGKLYGLMLVMASKVVESLGLVGRSFEEWSCQARVMSYKFTSQEDIGCIAAPLHTDSSFLTILHADECVGGLQIIDANGNFIDVDPLPGAIFVNIGDMGKVWSNGRLYTVKHRVVCKEVTTRFSIGLFLLAPKDGNIGTELAFIDAEHPKLYQNFIYNEYRKQRNKCEYKISDLALRVFKRRIYVVPVIDLANLPAELEKLAAASTELGCFGVSNHDMPMSLLAKMKEAARSLFEIPADVKLRNVIHNLEDGGYRPPTFSPKSPFYESLGIYDAASPADVHSFCSTLDASPQQWFRDTVKGTMQFLASAPPAGDCLVVNGGVLRPGRADIRWMNNRRTVLAWGRPPFILNIEGKRLSQNSNLDGFRRMSVVLVFQHTQTLVFGKLLGADTGRFSRPVYERFLTVLQEDECVGGLEIMDANGNFIDMDPLPGTLFVNIGDIGKVLIKSYF